MSVACAAGGGPHAARVLLTPAHAVETVRFMVNADTASPENPHGAVSLSPDGRRWIARLVRGDVARDGVWMEMVVGERASLEAATHVRTVARLFSSGLGAGGGRAGANQDGISWTSPLRWLDDESVAFLWSDAAGRRQVMRVNVRTAQVQTLSAHATGVLNFDIGADGTLMYSAMAAEAPSRLTQQLREGFVIEAHTDASSIIDGRVNDGSFIDRLWRTEWFVQRDAAAAPQPVQVAQRSFSPNQLERVWVSPRGQWALVNAVAPALSPDWNSYQDEDIHRRLKLARTNAYSMLGRLVHQLWVVDTRAGSSHALWSVPADSELPQCAWSSDGEFVLVAPTLLPGKDTDERGKRGTAAAIVERATGRYRLLPIDLQDQQVTGVQWLSRDRVGLGVGPPGEPRRIEFRRRAGQWRRVEGATSAATGVRLEIRQGIDTPPVLIAVDDVAGGSVTVIDPNPSLLTQFDLGHAELIEGEVEEGLRWQGMLFLPPNYDRARRYPLVIQSVYGSAIREEFTLYGFLQGYGLGPSLIPPYPGRLLAQHDVLVLQLNVAGEGSDTPQEGATRARAFERAAQQLIAEGRVDAAKVGLIGFSRNGFYVEYALTHSDFPYAAAIAADHFQPDYVGQTLLGYDTGAEGVNGGSPFGAGLDQWRVTSPGFNAERVRAPLLQIEQSSGLVGVLLHWELFSRLRYLGKPVEMWVIPNASLGVHNTQNPEQLIAIQSRVIDWFRFWLAGVESSDPSTQAQYRRWRELRGLRESERPGDG
ncbi:hypothetical protein [Povalibacter sp.]|uniref:hypothetical protein n=1 Tax=Povalibacter sp. TaxID=1962978 RepID=UPI002F40D845